MDDLARELIADPARAAGHNSPDPELCRAIIRAAPPEPVLFQLVSRFADVALLEECRARFSRALQESLTIQLLEQTTDAAYIRVAEQLVKQIQQPAKLARAQIAYLNLLYVNKHIVKASSIAQAVRASAAHLQPTVQAQLDLVSARISQASGDYFQAVGFYQEAFAQVDCAVDLLLCKILSGQFHEIEKIAQRHFNEQTKLCVRLAGVLRSRAGTYLADVQEICGAIESDLADVLLGAEIEGFIKRALRFYDRVEIDHISEISGVDATSVGKLVQRMILDGELDFQVDGNSGVLHRVEKQAEESVLVLRKAIEVVSALQRWV